MRIAIIAEVFLPKIDGVVGRTLNLIQQLLAHGDEVVVVCPEVSLPRRSPVPLIEFPGFPCPNYPEYIIGRPDRGLVRRLAEFQPDVIHFLNPFAFGFQCCDLLSRSTLNVPTLFSFHTLYGDFVKQYPGLKPLSGLLWWLMRRYHNTADMNLTVSSVMVEELRHRGFERVELWPPAVDSSRFSPNKYSIDMRSRLSSNHPESPLLLTVSRLAPEKNVGFLTEILQRVPHARLGIVGGGPQREELERRFAQYNAHFVGYLSGDELAQAYASADVFVYASETETMGNVILEALACGLPIVAADAGGVPSLLRHGIEGFLFPPHNGELAAGYVQQLLEEPLRRQSMSAAAVASVKHRTWDAAANEVRRDYKQLFENCTRSMTAGATRPRRTSGAVAMTCTKALVRMFLAASLATKRQMQPLAVNELQRPNVPSYSDAPVPVNAR